LRCQCPKSLVLGLQIRAVNSVSQARGREFEARQAYQPKPRTSASSGPRRQIGEGVARQACATLATRFGADGARGVPGPWAGTVSSGNRQSNAYSSGTVQVCRTIGSRRSAWRAWHRPAPPRFLAHADISEQVLRDHAHCQAGGVDPEPSPRILQTRKLWATPLAPLGRATHPSRHQPASWVEGGGSRGGTECGGVSVRASVRAKRPVTKEREA